MIVQYFQKKKKTNDNKLKKKIKSDYVQYIKFQNYKNKKALLNSKTSLIKVPIKEIENESESRKTNNLEEMNNSNSQKLILPYTIFKRNMTLNENLISGSENSYSSTYNSSSRTRLFSENTIKNHPLLINKDNSNNIENNNFILDKDKNNYLLNKESILSKFQSNRLHYIRNNNNKVKRNNSQRFTNSSSKNCFLKKDNEKSRSCLRLLSINPKEHSTSEKTLTFLTTNNNNNNNINNINLQIIILIILF